MCRNLSVAIAMICLLSAPASLFAQSPLFNFNYQSNILLESTLPFQHDLENPQTFSVIPAALGPQNEAIGYAQLFIPFDRPLYSLTRNEVLIYEYWQELKRRANRNAQVRVDRRVFNLLYNKPKIDEKKLIRMAWKKVFGVDVWYPYYKVKEIEDWVKERMSVRVCGFKGKPKFENDQILYVFKKKF